MKPTPEMEARMRELTISILSDENGISEDSYLKLVALARLIGVDDSLFEDVISKVEATNGRFYLPE